MTDVLTTTYLLPVTVTDDDGVVSGPEAITITVTNTKRKPTISNLPSTAYLPENTVTSTTIFTVCHRRYITMLHLY